MMTFINEIVSPEDKASVDWSAYHVSVLRRKLFEPYMWTIDKDRKIFLVEIGKKIPGPQDDPIAFGFNWHGTLIIFWARCWSKFESGETKWDIYWEFELPIPGVLQGSSEQIKTDLVEAIEAHGRAYCGRNIFRNVSISML